MMVGIMDVCQELEDTKKRVNAGLIMEPLVSANVASPLLDVEIGNLLLICLPYEHFEPGMW